MEGGYVEEEIQGKAYDGKLVRRLLGYVKPYAKWAVAGTLMLLLSSTLEILSPVLFKIAIDSYIMKNRFSEIWVIILAYQALILALSLSQFLQVYFINSMGFRVMYDLRLEVYSHIMKMDMSFFDKSPVGRLMTRVIGDIETLYEMLSSGFVAIFSDFFILIGIMIAMLMLSPRLGIFTISLFPLIIISTIFFRRFARQTYRLTRVISAKLNAFLSENVSGMTIIQATGNEKYQFEKFKKINTENRNIMMRALIQRAIYFPSIEIIMAVSIASVLVYGGYLLKNGLLEIGILVAFIQYIDRFFRPLQELTQKYDIMQLAMASSERIFQVLDTPSKINSPVLLKEPAPAPEKSISTQPAGEEIPVEVKPHITMADFEFEGPASPLAKIEKGHIKFEDVYFYYSPDKPVLKRVSFEVKPGQSVAIVGHTGAGKTTIASLLVRFYDVVSGRITIDGRDIRDYPLPYLRRSIGVVFQDVFLFAGDIASNIRLSSTEIPDEKIIQAAKDVNAHKFIEKLEGGYHAKVIERGAAFSSGEKQLLSFARALAFNPRILILDEATSSVDTETEFLIRDALVNLLKNRTSLIIAHRLSTIKHVDRIIVMHKGEIREEGTHEELLKKDGIYTRLYRLYAQREAN